MGSVADETRAVAASAHRAVAPGALVLRSNGYFVQPFGRRLARPVWLSPGRLTVTQGALDDGALSFTLDLVHPRVGGLIRHTATFREAGPCT